MTSAHQAGDAPSDTLADVLGYLNFSSGMADVQMLSALSRLVAQIEADGPERDDTWQTLHRLLTERLGQLRGQAAFRDATQAEAVLRLTFEHFIPAYRQFHRDLLAAQPDSQLWRPFMIGRVFEVILREGVAGEPHEIVERARRRFDDFVGHRPVAVLETVERLEPYEHEWVRPIPLFIRGAGVAHGRYRRLIEQAQRILETTDPDLLANAYFDPALVEEMSLDPRAYDFDHPVHKRPNYQFGQWDPHCVDNQGRYRRFVLQQVTLDGLLERVEQAGGPAQDALWFEASAVLAGAILMASGTSGSGPESHDSSTTLSTLVPKIAAYRDRFYQRLLQRTSDAAGESAAAKTSADRQPFGAARQHLNHFLARRRAAQLAHAHAALLFASMGYAEAGRRQAQVIPVTAARMRCEIQCRITSGHLAITAGQIAQAAELPAEAEEFLHRGIECGALVDPWNILGFQGQFSLLPAVENSIADPRVQQLVELVEQILSLYSRLWSEAAARDEGAICQQLSGRMKHFAHWWDRFAAPTIQGLEAPSGAEAFDSARRVGAALAAWHQAGAAAGDLAFWRAHVEHFGSPKAYALVIDALIEKRDFVAAMALLMQWLSRVDTIALRQGSYSFHRLARAWLETLCGLSGPTSAREPSVTAAERQKLVQRFFDYLEANAEDYWQVPKLGIKAAGESAEPVGPPADDDEDRYRAAYDEMVYVDSTDDSVEADMLEHGGPATEYELDYQARQITERLMLLYTAAGLWKTAVLSSGPAAALSALPDDVLDLWRQQAQTNLRGLADLLDAVERREVTPSDGTRDALLEYDRRRGVREGLLENVVTTTVMTTSADLLLRARRSPLDSDTSAPEALLRAVLAGDAAGARQVWADFLSHLRGASLLYVPLGRGGEARPLVQARQLQHLLRDLLRWLPRLGLLRETCQTIQAARDLEIERPAGVGAVSEFDRLFEVGYQALVETLVDVSRDWPDDQPGEAGGKVDSQLVDSLEQLTEPLLRQWLAHSRTLRLSSLERIVDTQRWQELVDFIQRYGGDLFTQRFLNLGNLRAILHQGVDFWLQQLLENAGDPPFLLVAELGTKISRAQAAERLGLVLEAVAENYSHYRDYNTTTTQSDHGELLYTLLDFLRLRAQYDRVAWHLRPVMMGHEVLIRRGRSAAADEWRRALAHRTHEVADGLQERYRQLCELYNMRLPTVAERLAERFVQPLLIDRVRGLVRPSIEEIRRGQPPTMFGTLEQEVAELMQEPTGVGLEVPAWLAALELEAHEAQRDARAGARAEETSPPIPQRPLSPEQVQQELSGWDSPSS